MRRTVRRERPDVVLLEIRMPDVDGLTVVREVRTMPDAPVVAMLTTFDADEYILTALNSGATPVSCSRTPSRSSSPNSCAPWPPAVVLSPKASRTLLRSHPGAGAPVDEEAARVRPNSVPTRPSLSLPGSQQGPVGLRKRADILHGTLEAGPTSEGGYRVRLRIPLSTATVPWTA